MVISNPFAFCSSDENDDGGAGAGAVTRLPADGYLSCSRDEFDDELDIPSRSINRTRVFSIVPDIELKDACNPVLKDANVDSATSRV